MMSLSSKFSSGHRAAKLVVDAALALGVCLPALVAPALGLTVNVACPSQSINAAIIAAFTGSGRPPTLERLTINVTGTCTENVVTAPLREVWLVGQAGAILQPASTNTPALRVFGGATVRNLLIRSSLSSNSPLIKVGPLAFLAIEESSVLSTTAYSLVEAIENSQLEIGNSTLNGGTQAALELFDSSNAVIYANHGNTLIRRPDGANNGQAIGCYQGFFGIFASNPPVDIRIGPAPRGIDSRGCTAVIHPDAGTIVRITGTSYDGINTKSGDQYSLVRTVITNNPGQAVEVSAGTMEIDASVIANNGGGLVASRGGIIRFNDIYGASTIGGPTPYSCYQEGHIFADPGHIAGNPASTSCLTVGGPVTH